MLLGFQSANVTEDGQLTNDEEFLGQEVWWRMAIRRLSMRVDSGSGATRFPIFFSRQRVFVWRVVFRRIVGGSIGLVYPRFCLGCLRPCVAHVCCAT